MSAAGTVPPLIGVLGGMGPLATVDFLHKLIRENPAARDQDHVPTVIWNVPQVPDRQKALAGLGPSPLPAMKEGIGRLNAAGATLIAIACNTAHFWYDELAAASAAPVLHIAEATIGELTGEASSGGPVGLVATRGLIASGLYQDRLAAAGIGFVVNNDDELDSLFTPGCYAVKRDAVAEGGRLLEEAGRRLLARGATRLVLACTEVPVALEAISSPLLENAVDTNAALARACIAHWSSARAATASAG